MNKIKIFLILSGYQPTWTLCIFGEKLKEPLIGVITGLIFIIFYYFTLKNKTRFLFILTAIALPGYLFDSIVVYFQVYNFNSNIIIGVLPIWMIVLWLSFATLFFEVFV